MADEAKESKGEQPPFDPYKLLDELKQIVNNNKNQETGGGKSWIGTLIIIAVVLVGVAIWSWISWRRGLELAKLRHEKNKTKILQEKAELDKKLTKNKITYIEAGKRIAEAEERLRVIEADIRAEEARYEADLRAIDSIRSWRDAGVR
jgi:uncharacterized protein HemX